ncbi:MAG: pseudouridine-5'-phosphate glycosidase [Pseudomonadota bacterium]
MTQLFTCSPAVADALAHNQPVVALESTIITHGMPYPENLQTAQRVEQIVRTHGAVPATVAVIDGTLHIGLTDAHIDALAQTTAPLKLSRADLAFAMAMGRTGSTTVAATMIAAHMAGIAVFATGGIGGVHRGAEHSFDISADLRELAITPVAVVCAGAKAILDLPKTFEVLETQGVPVIAYGQDEVPAFWSRTSGLMAPLRLNTPAQIAHMMQMRQAMPNAGGTLVCNPIPAGAEIPQTDITPIIAQAIDHADQQGIQGKALTPYLLAEMLRLTGGASLQANMALIENNAMLAAQIAVALSSSSS